MTLTALCWLKRNHSFTVEQFEQVMAFDGDEAMRKKWKAFCRKTDIKTDDYSTVLKAIRSLLSEPFAAAVEGRNYVKRWSGSENRWS